MPTFKLSRPVHLTIVDGFIRTLNEAADAVCRWQVGTDIVMERLCGKLRNAATADEAKQAETEFLGWAEAEGILLQEPVSVPLTSASESIDAHRADAPDVSATGEEETIDGLDTTEEALRKAIEDVPTGNRRRDRPVFDRAGEID